MKWSGREGVGKEKKIEGKKDLKKREVKSEKGGGRNK